MGRLTTHVLDTVNGRPGARMGVDLYRIVGGGREHVIAIQTNDDGRCDPALLEGDAVEAGVYELVFHAGPYFRRCGIDLPEPPFVDDVVVRFGIAEPGLHTHVPILVSPWSYTTYRGS